MSYSPVLGNPKPQYVDSSGVPLNGGKLYFYEAGTSTALDTYTDSTGSEANTNPVILNANGEPTSGIYGPNGTGYKVNLTDSSDVQITNWPIDNVYPGTLGNNSGWGPSYTVTYTDADTLTVSGTDVSDIFHVGRRVWCSDADNSANDVYGVVKSVSFSTDTTIDILVDNLGSINAATDTLYPSIIRADSKSSYPKHYAILPTETAANIYDIGKEYGDILRYIPTNLHAGIRAGTNTTDLSTYLQNCIDEHKKVFCSSKVTVLLENTVTGTTDIAIEGDNITIDASGSFTGTHVLSFEGTGLSQIEDLNADVAIGDTSFDLASTPSVVADDIFLIYNPSSSSWSGFNANYKAGEYCEVVSVSTNTIKLKNPLYDSYTAANVDVYKQTSITPVINNLTILGSSTENVLNLEYCRNARINNVRITHDNNSCIRELNCYGTEINNPYIDNTGDTGDDYGWLVVASQHCKMIGGYAYARRHPVTMGGGTGTGIVPCRDIKAIGGTFKNDVASGTHCFDWHGHAEDCVAVDCLIYGGATWQGANNGYINCTIYSYEGTEYVTIRSNDILGGRHFLLGCTLINYGDPSSGNRGIIDVGGNSNDLSSNTTRDTLFVIKNLTVIAPAISTSTSIIIIRNRGATVNINADIDNITLDVNALARVLFMDLVSGTANTEFVRVGNYESTVTPNNLPIDIRNDYDAGNYQTVTASGAVDLIHKHTRFDTTGGAIAATLADSHEGHEKFLVMTVDGGTDVTLTPTSLGNGTTITFDDVGDCAHLIFIGAAWHMVGGTATLA